MRKLTGVAASPGIAVGVAHFLGDPIEVQERRIFQDEIESELARWAGAP